MLESLIFDKGLFTIVHLLEGREGLGQTGKERGRSECRRRTEGDKATAPRNKPNEFDAIGEAQGVLVSYDPAKAEKGLPRPGAAKTRRG